MVLWGLCALAVEKSATIVYINGSKYYIHTVQPGETLYALSKAYQVGERVIVESNPSAAEGLKVSEKIKIPYVMAVTETVSEKKLAKRFNIHFVTKGETLYSVSRTFEIPIQTIIEDNPNLDPIHLRVGERMLLRKSSIGEGDEAANKAQWEQYRQSLNSVSEAGTSYHIVQPGETFYSLSRRYGVTEADLGALNNGLKAPDLKAGGMIKVPGGKGDAAVAESSGKAPEGEGTQTQGAQPEPEKARRTEFQPLQANDPLNIALLLPMTNGAEANNNYLEFYQGFLMGLQSLRDNDGRSANVTLFDTKRNAAEIGSIIESPGFASANLIVGPVYEEGLSPVVRAAEQRGIPVISPLANLTSTTSDVLFQMAPDPRYKYEKVRDLITPDKRVTLIYASSTDKEFEQEMLSLLKDRQYDKHTYKYVHPWAGRGAGSSSDLTPLLDNGDDNVLIIVADNEIDVDRILAGLASAETSITARGRTTPRFVVLGNARWNRYNNLDRTMFFKNRLVFISTYHAKRDAQAVTDFDSAYIRAFSSLPTLYSYRGYDAATIFAQAMYNDIHQNLEGRTYTPLQTAYIFEQDQPNGNHANRNWMRVNYNNDFTITIE